jgi:hypothetical protein
MITKNFARWPRWVFEVGGKRLLALVLLVFAAQLFLSGCGYTVYKKGKDAAVNSDNDSGTGGTAGTGGTRYTGDSGGSGGRNGSGGTDRNGDGGGIGGRGGTDESGGIAVPNSYTMNDDGTVTDQTTGLMWMQCPAGQSGSDCSTGSATNYTYREARDYCDNLNFASHDDWRLPEINELASIVDYTKFNPATNETAFPATTSDEFWSSPVGDPSDSTDVWAIYFYNGNYDGYNGDDSDAYDVRCVRGGSLVIGSFERSVISGDPIVRDTATGLTWQGCSASTAGVSGASCDQGNETKYNWQQAIDYCENLTWAGYSDWRLPAIHELISIIDYTKSDPAVDTTAFPATNSGSFWSSSSLAYDSSKAWGVYFFSGQVYIYGKTSASYNGANADYARCVRG